MNPCTIYVTRRVQILFQVPQKYVKLPMLVKLHTY